MPRIKRKDKTKFPMIVEQLIKLHSDFTLSRGETSSRFELGAVVTHSDMPRIKKDIYVFKVDYPAENVKAGDRCTLVSGPYFDRCGYLADVKLSDNRIISCFAWRVGL